MRPDAGTRTTSRPPRFLTAALLAGALLLAAPAVAPAPVGADPVADAQAQATQAGARLNQLEATQMDLEGQAQAARRKLADAQAAVADARTRAEQARAELDRRQAELRTYAVGAYVDGNDAPAFEALLTSDPSTGVEKRSYLESLSGNRQDLVDELAASRARAEADQKALAQAQAEQQRWAAEIQTALDGANRAVADQQAVAGSLDAQARALLDEQRRAEQAARQAAARAATAAATRATTTAPATPAPGAPTTTTGPVPAPPPAPTGGTGGGGRTAPDPGQGGTDPAPPQTPGAAGVVATAQSKLGAPYVWAAAGPDAFDCSGFTMWVWAQHGRSLGHYTGSQWAQTAHISLAQLQPGDLVFFWGPGDGADPGHVGLYVGGGMMIHAPGAGRVVRYDSIRYWTGATVRAGRVR